MSSSSGDKFSWNNWLNHVLNRAFGLKEVQEDIHSPSTSTASEAFGRVLSDDDDLEDEDKLGLGFIPSRSGTERLKQAWSINKENGIWGYEAKTAYYMMICGGVILFGTFAFAQTKRGARLWAASKGALHRHELLKMDTKRDTWLEIRSTLCGGTGAALFTVSTLSLTAYADHFSLIYIPIFGTIAGLPVAMNTERTAMRILGGALNYGGVIVFCCASLLIYMKFVHWELSVDEIYKHYRDIYYHKQLQQVKFEEILLRSKEALANADVDITTDLALEKRKAEQEFWLNETEEQRLRRKLREIQDAKQKIEKRINSLDRVK